jgi:PAS domain S-box-containing protein
MNDSFEAHVKAVFGEAKLVPPEVERLLARIEQELSDATRSFETRERALAMERDQLAAQNREYASQLAQRDQDDRITQARFHAFMDNTPMICALKDAHGILLYANKTCERHFPHLPTLGGAMSFAWLPPEIAGTREEDAAMLASGQAVATVRTVPLPGGQRHWLIYRFPVPDAKGTLVGLSALDITERREVEEAMARQALILETILDAVIVTDLAGRVTGCNAAATALFGFSRQELEGKPPLPWRLENAEVSLERILASAASTGRWSGDLAFRTKDGADGVCETVIVPLRDEASDVTGLIAVSRDMTERRALERQMHESQKLEAIGQLAAGIAHEINTPNQYVTDNVHFLEGAFQDLLEAASQLRALVEPAREHASLAAPVAHAEAALRAAEIDYLATEVPSALRQSLDGLRRIAEIVKGVKAFAHPGSGAKTGVDLNATLGNVISMARNEWKYVAVVETSFAPDLPPVPCHAGEIDQVFLNVLVNAAHAIADVATQRPEGHGRITVSTRRDGDHVEVRIADDGPGIPPDVRPRIFDPFFTTKPVGRGTGQGLAISHRLVVERHGGSLSFETEIGRGTTFVIRLPLAEDEGELRMAA